MHVFQQVLDFMRIVAFPSGVYFLIRYPKMCLKIGGRKHSLCHAYKALHLAAAFFNANKMKKDWDCWVVYR